MTWQPQYSIPKYEHTSFALLALSLKVVILNYVIFLFQKLQIIVFQLTPGTDQSALADVLADHGLTLVGEPTAKGVYRASLFADTLPEDTAEALMSTPEIMFAAPEGQQ